MASHDFPRRNFLRATVVTALSSGALPLAGCGDDTGGGKEPDPPDPNAGWPSPAADVARVYPQGIASGDPRPDSVILWTRVEPADAGKDVDVEYDVATDGDFADVVATGKESALAAADHTLRLKVTGLSAFTKYYYRFKAQDVWSDLGETKTAPAPDQDVPVRFAFATCQDFIGRYYHAWKALAEEDPVDFVVFLGDYVYETDGDPSFMTAGSADRKIVLPDGLQVNSATKAAQTLTDYRSLYKQYRSDPDLQRAHRLYPFICIWDDHEFANDCWQDNTTHFDDDTSRGEQKVPQQREAADQAWFEYQPADVEYDESASYPNDIKIYRQLRFGKNMELFLTDQRYYRDDHLIPEGSAPDLTLAHLSQFSEIGSRIFVFKDAFDPKEAAAAPSLLGATQKAWLVDGVTASDATWKIWGSEVQLAQMVADLTSFQEVNELVRVKVYLTTDQWDGYRTERAEILQALSGVNNLMVIVGDIHAFYAAELHVDFDAPAATPVAVEYTVAGITSHAIAPAAEGVLRSDPTFETLGLLNLIPAFDTILIDGNPHYKYANSFNNGIAICDLAADQVEVTFLVVNDVTDAAAIGVAERVKFRTAAGTNRVEKLT